MEQETGMAKDDEEMSQTEKGYDLPMDEKEKAEAETDCGKVMSLIKDIYVKADKGDSINVVVPQEIIEQMKSKVKETGQPVQTTDYQDDMDNYRKMDSFLKNCQRGIAGQLVSYKVCFDGSVSREKYIFDGTDLFLLGTKAVWIEAEDEKYDSGIASFSYNRVKEWEYTKEGWFCYELCVPEPPEVTEIVDGSCRIRVR